MQRKIRLFDYPYTFNIRANIKDLFMASDAILVGWETGGGGGKRGRLEPG